MMIGELLALHPPDVVRRMTVREARACLRAVYAERRRTARLAIEAAKAQQDCLLAVFRAMAGAG